MHTYPEPPFGVPLSSTFLYAAWSIDPVRVGPFVRSSVVRRQRIETIRAVARELAHRLDVEDVRVFEASFIPPLPGMPKYDVIVLVRAQTRSCAELIRDDPAVRGAEPATLFLATNAARFGDTETPASGVNILLNHFVGPPDRSVAVDTWRLIAGWYQAKAGVDNSTLLRTEDDAPYLVVNYARLPGGVVAFMLQQLLRPSFYGYVRGLLTRNLLTALPLFVRNVPLDSADG
jgi:hypothetical protein